MTELATKLGMSQPNFSKRLRVGKFTQPELEEIGKALGAEYKSGFYFPDGDKIEEDIIEMMFYFFNTNYN